jgi:hypothetical protein
MCGMSSAILKSRARLIRCELAGPPAMGGFRQSFPLRGCYGVDYSTPCFHLTALAAFKVLVFTLGHPLPYLYLDPFSTKVTLHVVSGVGCSGMS